MLYNIYKIVYFTEIVICDPVCGIDIVTYGNECLARCAHTPIAYLGIC